MKRLERIVDQLDSKSASDEIRILQIQYATAQEIADKVQKLFESKAQKPVSGRAATSRRCPAAADGATGTPPGQPGVASGESAGPATLSQIIPDERTNKLIVIASPAAFDRILALIAALDIPGPPETRSTSTRSRTRTPKISRRRCRRSRRAPRTGRRGRRVNRLRRGPRAQAPPPSCFRAR